MRAYLSECERIEQIIGRIYTRLASVEGYSDGLRGLLRQLAEDEEGHARLLEMAKGVPAEIFFEETRLSPESLAELREEVLMFLSLSDNPPRSEEEVLAMIRQLENGCLQVHLANSVHFREKRYGDLFLGLARSDEEHLKAIEDYERLAGKSPTRH
jgi:rubrerythrin